MHPIAFGELKTVLRPAKYSSSETKASDMKKIIKFVNDRIFGLKTVDLCLKYKKKERMIEFIDIEACQSRILPSDET